MIILTRLLVLWLLLGTSVAFAFETLQAIRREGVLDIGLHQDDRQSAAVWLAHGFAASLGVRPNLVWYQRKDRMLEALADGEVDVVGSPVDMARPIPVGLRFSEPVDEIPLVLAGRLGPVAVRYGSDEWYRALALRSAGKHLELEVVPASKPREALLQSKTRRALLFAPKGGEVMATGQPRAWVVRDADRVLAFKVDRYLHAEALIADARGRTAPPEARLIRAVIRDGSLSRFDHLARDYAGYFGFDWRLILAIMETESGFDPSAVSHSGARGLMQLKPIAAQEVGISDVNDPQSNVLAGVRYLAWARDQFEADLDPAQRTWFALAAYNGGVSRVQAARELAARSGLDPRRWSGSVERALLELGRRRGDFDAEQMVNYVEKVRSRLAAYVRATERLKPAGAGVTGQTSLAP